MAGLVSNMLERTGWVTAAGRLGLSAELDARQKVMLYFINDSGLGRRLLYLASAYQLVCVWVCV